MRIYLFPSAFGTVLLPTLLPRRRRQQQRLHNPDLEAELYFKEPEVRGETIIGYNYCLILLFDNMCTNENMQAPGMYLFK